MQQLITGLIVILGINLLAFAFLGEVKPHVVLASIVGVILAIASEITWLQ